MSEKSKQSKPRPLAGEGPAQMLTLMGWLVLLASLAAPLLLLYEYGRQTLIIASAVVAVFTGALWFFATQVMASTLKHVAALRRAGGEQ